MTETCNIYMQKIKRAFLKACDDYRNMFETHYPKASGGGLNEATQTHYFCKNLVDIINETISDDEIKASSSFELPVYNGQRIDSLIVSPTTKEIFYVETKRLRGGNKRDKEKLLKDVNKVWKNRDYIWNGNITYNCHRSEIDEYIIILTDIWVHSRLQRRQIPYWWAGTQNQMIKEYFLDTDFRELADSEDKERFYKHAITINFNWKKENQLIYRFINKYEDYCLLCGFSRIPKA